MGAYLDTPITDKHTETGSGHDSRFAVSSMQGWRRNMEDDHVAIPEIATSRDGAKISIYAVFDGHGGAEVAKFAHKYYPQILSNCNDFKQGGTVIHVLWAMLVRLALCVCCSAPDLFCLPFFCCAHPNPTFLQITKQQ